MLKGLKGKKGAKEDSKKDSKKDKPKEQAKKKKEEEEEEDTNDALVDINYEEKEKEKKTANHAKKPAAYKLEEKQIDTSNIKIEKKEEKPKITSWVVNEADIKGLLNNKDFDATKHETEFESLTDEKLNKELEEKAKKEAEENKNKPQVEEINGFKFAPLAPSGPTTGKVDVNEPLMNFRKPAVDVNAPPTSLPVTQINPPTFTNSKIKDFAPLEKSAQQLKEEQMQRKLNERGGGIVLKGEGQSSWLGGRKTGPVVEEPKQEVKLSGWALKGMQEGDIAPPAKFAPLNPTAQQKRYQRQEQQFVFTSKKEQQERRKKREAEEAAKLRQ